MKTVGLGTGALKEKFTFLERMAWYGFVRRLRSSHVTWGLRIWVTLEE